MKIMNDLVWCICLTAYHLLISYVEVTSQQHKIIIIIIVTLTRGFGRGSVYSHQDPVLNHHGSPSTANRWPHWGVLPLYRCAVGVFYSPSRQGGSRQGSRRLKEFCWGCKNLRQGQVALKPWKIVLFEMYRVFKKIDMIL